MTDGHRQMHCMAKTRHDLHVSNENEQCQKLVPLKRKHSKAYLLALYKGSEKTVLIGQSYERKKSTELKKELVWYARRAS